MERIGLIWLIVSIGIRIRICIRIRISCTSIGGIILRFLFLCCVTFGLLVGAEAVGLPVAIADAADERFTILMPGGAESLNAAVAASIAMHTLTQSV